MDKDDLAWEKSDEEVEAWERSLNKAHIYREIANLIIKYRPGEAVELHQPIRGGYNIFYRLEYKDGSSAAMRIPCKGIVKFPEEKMRYEVATMRYVAANTTIPVPKMYHFGTAAENPIGLGPFMIMEYIEHERTLSEALKDPSLKPDESHVLDPKIDEDRLEFLYGQMANIVLQLSTLSFPRIGSLDQQEGGEISISGRPLIQNMNSLLEFTGVASTLLPSRPYATSEEWFCALADMHLAQLTFQHNDAVDDEDDARDKYVARQLFRRLALEGRLTLGFGGEKNDSDNSKFLLYSEDLRPSNVLVDKNDCVVGVIDWEFAYAAPRQFSFDPPWWLLLKSPEYWDGGYKSWMEACEPRFETFLRILEAEEKKATTSSLFRDVPLSQRMRNSWKNKTWMINHAARDSWVFDFIFWRFLDVQYFGENEQGDHHARLNLLTKQQIEVMEPFIRKKMEESEKQSLVEWDHDRAVAELAEVLI
ncbi:kinase-like domain-containing protein [Daldinia bambusicola]|nr:kinase-like domain-containing protein [Daldinia bambusicola]